MVGEDLRLLVLRQLLEIGVRLVQQQIQEEPEDLPQQNNHRVSDPEDHLDADPDHF